MAKERPEGTAGAFQVVGVGASAGGRVDPELLASYDRLLDRFMPPSFLVDENAQLLDSFAGAERFLRAKARRPTSNLLEMLEGDLRTVVAGALGRVARERMTVTSPNVGVDDGFGAHDYTVRLELVQQPRAEQCHVLVTLERSPEAGVRPSTPPTDEEVTVAQASLQRLQSLEGELFSAKEILQSTIEELATSNEALQATNEELVASNEELQNMNEELCSVNEELYTNAQRETQQQKLQIQELLDSTAEAISGVDVSGICTFCNLSCARLLGYRSPSELIGRDMHELLHRGRLATSPHECRLTSAFRGGGPAHSGDEVFWRADGSYFAAEYWSHPVERDGKVTGAVVTFLDITERRRAEEEVRAAARRRERFLALLSHELRNPLSAILNAIRVVSAGAGAKETQERARQVVDRQGRHMARLLDDLLDVSRITSGKFELRTERVCIDEAVTAAIEALEPLLRDHGLTLAATLPRAPLLVDGDGARLQQVVANLLSNAARYSQGGSRIELTLGTEGTSAVLSVRDWGVGIEPAFLPHVFELFAQSDQAARMARGGLGIGLTLVRRIVELHDGTVEAKSAGPGLGSEFIVRVPLSTGAEARAGQPVVDGVDLYRIVLVEDQADAREMMRALLELRGHTVMDVGDGREAIETIGREHPDVAVVDIGLPELSGYDVARAVRAAPGGDQVFMVALTGYGSQADVRAAEEAGFDAHLTKPAEPERLYQLLARRAPAESRRRSGDWSGVDAADPAEPSRGRRTLTN